MTAMDANASEACVALPVRDAQLEGQPRASKPVLRLQVAGPRRDLPRPERGGDMVSASPCMHEVLRLIAIAAASPITVLIQGETGTGKELVARGIHGASGRAGAPFLAVNCAAIPETLLESELFGHRRGAFTGALQDRHGVFEAASGGTILLDEVGDMPLPMQGKLLRVLQEGEITPVGDHRPRAVDVRIIAATNRDLGAEMRAGRFRADLYYRLAVFPIQLPPLRVRRDDIPLLAERFISRASARHRKQVPGMEPEALERMVAFSWPGNIRELENEIERAVALAAAGARLGVDQLSPKLVEPPAVVGAAAAPVEAIVPLREARADFERRYLREVLRQLGGNVSRAARAVRLSRGMLQRKMIRYGLRP
jgi:transcriptional regulator with GAF, ATPase, and Fis domain